MAFYKAQEYSLLKDINYNSSTAKRFLDDYKLSLTERLVKDINNYIPSKTFAPSSFRCKRAQWFRLTGTTPDEVITPNVELEFVSNIGTHCHEEIQRYLSSANFSDSIKWLDVSEYLESHDILYSNYHIKCNGFETKIEIDDPPIHFSCDGLVEFEDVVYLLEIKTSDHKSFEYLVEPKSQHRDQIMCYCTMMNIDHAIALYQDRQYGHVKCFTVDVTSDDKKYILDVITDVIDKKDKHLCPPPLEKGKDRYCTPSYCRYYNTCKNQY